MTDQAEVRPETYLDTNVLLRVLQKETKNRLQDPARDRLVAAWATAAELSTFLDETVRQAMNTGGSGHAAALSRAAHEVLDNLGPDGNARPNGIPVEFRTMTTDAAAFVLAVAASPMLAYAVPEPAQRDPQRDYFRKWASDLDMIGSADFIITNWAAYSGANHGGQTELLSMDSLCRELASRIGFSATDGEPRLRDHCVCTDGDCPRTEHLKWGQLAAKHKSWSALTRRADDLAGAGSAVLFTHSAFNKLAGTPANRVRASQDVLDQLGRNNLTVIGFSTALMLQHSAIDRYNYVASLRTRKNGRRKTRNSPPVDPAVHALALAAANARSTEYRGKVQQVLRGVYPLLKDNGAQVATNYSIIVPDLETMKNLTALRDPANGQLSLEGHRLHPPLHTHEEVAIAQVLRDRGCDLLVVAAGEQADRLGDMGFTVSRI